MTYPKLRNKLKIMKRIFEREARPLTLISIFLDIAVLSLVDILAFRLYLGKDFIYSRNFTDYQWAFLYVILFKLLCLYIFQVYSQVRFKTTFVIVISVIKATLAGSLIMGLVAYAFRFEAIPRAVVLISWVFSMLALVSWRILGRSVLRAFLGGDFFRLHILIIGTNKSAEEMAIWLLNNGLVNYKLVGFISDDPKEARKQIVGHPVIGALGDIKDISRQFRIDRVFVLTPKIEFRELARIFSAFRRKREVTFCTAPELCEDAISTEHFVEGRIQFIPAVPFQRFPIWYPPLKRVLDLVLALFLLALLSPFMIVIVLLIKISSSGPVFYLTRRIGFMGKEFVMFKFRSMYHLSSQRRFESWARKDDARIMPIGRIMRRFRLDELPQLINVIKNEMSLIGPRPETQYYVMRLSKKIALYAERLNAKPGITGWAQVNYGYAGTVEDNRKKLLLDIYYIQNQSVALDLLIFLKTFKTVLAGIGV